MKAYEQNQHSNVLVRHEEEGDKVYWDSGTYSTLLHLKHCVSYLVTQFVKNRKLRQKLKNSLKIENSSKIENFVKKFVSRFSGENSNFSLFSRQYTHDCP